MVQAGLSTILSLLVLATIHAYMVQVFVKVVTLVVGLGMIHGLLVLPIVYGALNFKKQDNNKNLSRTNKITPIVFSTTANVHDIEINSSLSSAPKQLSLPTTESRPDSIRG